MKSSLLLLSVISLSSAFAPVSTTSSRRAIKLFMAEEDDKAAPLVSGEELEMMLQEWDQPLVLDAYATWVSLHVSFILVDAVGSQWKN